VSGRTHAIVLVAQGSLWDSMSVGLQLGST